MVHSEARKIISLDFGSKPEIEGMCMRVIDYLTNQPLQSLEHISFAAIQEASGSASMDDLALLVRYLTGAAVPVLDVRFEFIDDDFCEFISAETIAEVRSGRPFFHPETGEEVKNFESKVFVHFSLSKEGQELRRGF